MSIWEIMNRIDDQSITLEQARAVLSEVIEEFEVQIAPGSTEAMNLVNKLPHIVLLLHVANRLLYDMEPQLNNVCNELLCIHRNQSGEVAVA